MVDKEIFRVLKDKRETKGFSIEEVSQHTGLPVKVIKDLEGGRIENIHSVYLRGFMKIYADFLHVDANDYLDKLVVPRRTPESHRKKETVKSIRSHLVKKAVKTTRFAGVLKVAGILVVALVVIFSVRSVFIQLSRMASKKKEARKVSAQKAEVSKQEEKLPAEKVEPVVAKEDQEKLLNVELFARKTVYVEVKADTRTVYSNVFVQGFSETFTAKKEIFVRAGDGNAIEVQINGRYIGLISNKKGTVEARITPRGIKLLR